MNKLMNHFRMLGDQYKAAMYDFLASSDEGISTFLRAEMMERYETSDKIARYMGKGVVISASLAPQHHGASIQGLQALVALEAATVKELDMTIANSEPGPNARFIQYLRNCAQYEHDEVSGVVGQISRISGDPGAMSQYNIFLDKKYGSRYHNPCGD